MSVLPTTKTHHDVAPNARLHADVHRTARRGRLLVSARALILCTAAFVGGLWITALKDALFVLPGWLRIVVLLALLITVLSAGLAWVVGAWRSKRLYHAAGEQIDRAAQANGQPVTTGLSLIGPMDDDSLALELLRRAEARAADVATAVKPNRAYPLQRLRPPARWLALALGLWLMLAVIAPRQVLAVASRVLLPWSGAPPFSLTGLEPNWSPEPPEAGDEVWVSVTPTGLSPQTVAWLRLDERGRVAERFEMQPDGQGGFSLRLRSIETPIVFRLEARGRHTRTYTITPTPRATLAEQAQATDDESAEDEGGVTRFDPDKIARRDLADHDDWPGTRAALEDLLSALAQAQADAEAIDPTDLQAVQVLDDKLAELTAQAQAIAGRLATMQGELPEGAASLLGKLKDALATMQTAALPAPPGQADAGQAAPWLKQAGDAAKADQQRIGQGLGPSEEPTRSGTGSGSSTDAPDIRDPAAAGTSTERNASGSEGPLPDSVMQQVPPSYRGFVETYFDKLADE